MLKEEKFTRVLVRPLLTEKTTLLSGASTGVASSRQCVVFEVGMNFNKSDIKKAVSSLFGVDVIAVRTVNVKERYRNRRSRVLGVRHWKKAYVSLKPGQAQMILEDGHNVLS